MKPEHTEYDVMCALEEVAAGKSLRKACLQFPRNNKKLGNPSYWDVPLPLEMLWYLVADAGCSPIVADRMVKMRYPNYSSSSLRDKLDQWISRFDPNNPNEIMEEIFHEECRSVDYRSQDALKQDWVSVVHKKGIELNERTCAHLSWASLCICAREERMLRLVNRGTLQMEKNMDATALAFEDKNFMDLKKTVLGRIGPCSCPLVSVAIASPPRNIQ